MRAFIETKVTKAELLTQLQHHYDHDEIVKGRYWEGGKGCAVGCSVHSGDHFMYESQFGIPVALARLEDCIFEGLPNELAKEWPIRFTRAVPVGADLSLVVWKFLHIVVGNALRDFADPNTRKLCQPAMEVISKKAAGIGVPYAAATAAATASNAAAYAAAYVAYAANAAAYAAATASTAAAYFANAAAYAAATAAADAAADDAADFAYVRQSDILVELIESTPSGGSQ